MIQALRYEWLRITTLRSTWWITLGTIVIASGLTFLVSMGMRLGSADEIEGSLSEDESREIVEMMMTQFSNFDPMFYLAAYVIAILGVLGWGHEYRHGMIRATLTALPSRISVLVAKVIVIAALAGITVLGCALLILLISVPFDVTMPTFSGFRDITIGTALYVVLFSISGVAFATIVRNQTAAVVMILLIPSVVEQLVKGVIAIIRVISDEPLDKGGVAVLLKYLPYDAGAQMYTQFSLDDLLEPFGVTSFGPVGGGLVMGTFVAILLAISTALFLRRDA